MLDLMSVKDPHADGAGQDDMLRLTAVELFQVLLGPALRYRLSQGRDIQAISSR